jgi:predicted  nucleic acid-binding Zn-ribbon protein
MKATQNQQQDLLHLHSLATEVERTRSAINAIVNDPVLEAKRSEQLAVASDLIAAHNALEAVDIELKRANEDLALVEQRISRDAERLNATASSKDAQGIQNEMGSLQKRLSELEDVTLFIIERQEQASQLLAEITATKAAVDSELAAIEAAGHKETMKLQSAGSLLVQEFNALKVRISPEHLDRYTKLAARGVPIGRLVGRDCGACHMSLGANAFDVITNLPADEFASCPDCSALLVRG